MDAMHIQRDRCFELAKQIMDVEATRLTALDRSREVTVGLARIKADLKGKISMATGPDGKSLFSNDAKREAALAESLCANADYMKLEQENNDLNCAIGAWNNELEYLRRCYQIEALFFEMGFMPQPNV